MIATLTPVSIVDTKPLMVSLHDDLRRGISPADALRSARATTDPDHDGSFATAASFVCFGA